MVKKSDKKTPELAPVLVRMPDTFRDKVKAEAEANRRSMNAEIIHRIEGYARLENSLRLLVNGDNQARKHFIALAQMLISCGDIEISAPDWCKDIPDNQLKAEGFNIAALNYFNAAHQNTYQDLEPGFLADFVVVGIKAFFEGKSISNLSRFIREFRDAKAKALDSDDLTDYQKQNMEAVIKALDAEIKRIDDDTATKLQNMKGVLG